MFAAFIESVKYVGHLIPLAFLRIFLGSLYLSQALQKFHSDFLARPRMASQIAEILPSLDLPMWYKNIIEGLVIQHWQSFAFIFLAIEFAIAVSYFIGYVVRPMGVIAAFVSLNLLYLTPQPQNEIYLILVALHLAMAWVGAGRCIGVDYYFFKRRRGLWW